MWYEIPNYFSKHLLLLIMIFCIMKLLYLHLRKLVAIPYNHLLSCSYLSVCEYLKYRFHCFHLFIKLLEEWGVILDTCIVFGCYPEQFIELQPPQLARSLLPHTRQRRMCFAKLETSCNSVQGLWERSHFGCSRVSQFPSSQHNIG